MDGSVDARPPCGGSWIRYQSVCLKYRSRRLGRDRCPECPKSGGSEACPKCSPLNFCFLTEHGNSSDDAMSKAMCPKCSPHNFCRDTGHGNSEESPAHKSSCVKCSPEYFGRLQTGNSEEDEDLARAIEASMVEQVPEQSI